MDSDTSHSFQDLVLPALLVTALTLISASWIQQRRLRGRTQKTNQTNPAHPTNQKSQKSQEGQTGLKGLKNSAASATAAAVAAAVATNPPITTAVSDSSIQIALRTPAFARVWSVERSSPPAQRVAFGSQKFALLYCTAQNARLLAAHCKVPGEAWRCLWTGVTAPEPFDLKTAVLLDQGRLTTLCHAYLFPFSSGAVDTPCWVGKVLKRSELQAQGHVIWTDRVALREIEKIEIETINRKTAETESEGLKRPLASKVEEPPPVHMESMLEQAAADASAAPAMAVLPRVDSDNNVVGAVAHVTKKDEEKEDKEEHPAGLVATAVPDTSMADKYSADIDDILGAALASSSDSESNSEHTRTGSPSPNLDAMLDSALSDEDDDGDDAKGGAAEAPTIDLDDMLDGMFSEDDGDDEGDGGENAKYLDGITDHGERKALLLLTAAERKYWRSLLDRDKIRQQAMPPTKPLSKALTKLMAPTSAARKRTEEFSGRSHASSEVFDIVFGRALQEAGVARPGQPVRLNMHPEQLGELRSGYKHVFRVELRDRLVRDVDFDAGRFSDASKAFL
jgi:hypothetical protein